MQFVTPDQATHVLQNLRPADTCMSPAAMGSTKASRISFARVLARRMINERWRIEREFFRCDGDGDGQARYRIDINGRRLTYVVRSFGWDGVEKVGRRADGAYRDLYSAIFDGAPSDERIGQEINTFNTRDASSMRTDAMVTGWAPGNRSVRYFDHVVDALTAGRQPDIAFIGEGGGYVLRNGGYNGSGRNATLSYEGYPSDHPFRYPYFADLFALYLVRMVSIDLVNAIAAARNANAASLHPDIARYLGIGNSSGQGMCVALQRWPHWVSTWVTVRELCIAYVLSMPMRKDSVARLDSLLQRAVEYLSSVRLPCEDYVTPNAQIAQDLLAVQSHLRRVGYSRSSTWGEFVAETCTRSDRESIEQLHSLLIELYPDFADAVSDYLDVGSQRERSVEPDMTVSRLRELIVRNYRWALREDLSAPGAREHFWYHSADNGEQRRGQRGVDPHEHYESFIDHIGLVQRLFSVLSTYPDTASAAEVIADNFDLAYGISRVQYLASLPYAEIRGNLVAREFIPAQLIRFLLATFGIECSSALSVQYVRGVFFQGMPLPDAIARGVSEDWQFPMPPRGVALS